MQKFNSYTSRHAGKISRIIWPSDNFVRHLMISNKQIAAIFTNYIKSVVENAAMTLESNFLNALTSKAQ